MHVEILKILILVPIWSKFIKIGLISIGLNGFEFKSNSLRLVKWGLELRMVVRLVGQCNRLRE